MELITIAVVVIHLSSKCSATLFLHNSRAQDSRPREMRDTEFFVNVIRQDINSLNKNIENLHHSQSSSICNDIQKQMTFHSDLLKLMNVRITRLIRFLVKDEEFEDTHSTEPTPEVNTLPSRNLGSFITNKLLGIKRRLNLDENYIDPVGNVSPNVNNNVDERKVTDNKQGKQEENENLETTTDYFPLGLPQNPFASMFMETTTSRQNILEKFNECKYR